MSTSSARPEPGLDERKSAILRAIVEEYVESAQPVGSQTIARSGDLGVSSATIRNEMTFLEREGYIAQPHTSAGRIPTDRGYRYFVDHLAGRGTLGPPEQRAVADFFGHATRALEDVLHETSGLLTRLTRHAAVVVGPNVDVGTVRSAQLVAIQPDVVLAVAVLSNGVVEKVAIELDRPLDDDQVARASAAFARSVEGTTTLSPRAVPPSGDADVDALAVRAAGELARAATSGAHEPVFVGGASRIAAEREAFSGPETVARLLELLEHQYLVVALVRELIDRGLRVSIGAENELAELQECSIVTAPFLVEGEPAGTVAVLGPTRMKYPQAMAAVSVVSRRLGRHLSP